MEDLEILWGGTHTQYTHTYTHMCMRVFTYTDILVLCIVLSLAHLSC